MCSSSLLPAATSASAYSIGVLFFALCFLFHLPNATAGVTRHYQFDENGLKQTLKLLSTRHFKLEVVLMSLTPILSMDFLDPCIIARQKVIFFFLNHSPKVALKFVGLNFKQLCMLWLTDTFKLKVKPGKTYLLRLINAALNDELFFSIANHTLTVVDADAVYVKPFETDSILITPGQTTNVLLKTKPYYPKASFVMAARPYVTGQGTFDNSTTTGILEYISSSSIKSTSKLPLFGATLPPLNDTSAATNFTLKFRSLANKQYPANVPKNVEKRFFFTVGLGTNPCPKNHTCQGPNGSMFSASVNNVSFALPTTALLQAHFTGQSNRVYSPYFPYFPIHPFDYTGNNTINNTNVISNTTNLVVLPFGTCVELIMQDTSILGAESHPLHLHGYNFFVLGQGFGNYDPINDPAKFNLVDPVERNTVGVPSGGWVAIRFRADNPGVWFMHCHLEIHTSWGLKMAWLVLDGQLPNQKLPPPPSDLPKC
ncbi:hypothetical protein MKX01_033211 [Papaver californicum]|nr:hypothetical protein MKX01_033211 [Papaver californicum]